jgi:hypothetical protein
MNFYIQVKDGQPINHPAFEQNILQAFKEIPLDWEIFVRVERPSLGAYQFLAKDEPSYKKVDGVWTDVWDVQELPADEILAKQNIVKNAWASRRQFENWATWVFNEASCAFEPPIPAPKNDPEDEKIWRWRGSENNWVEEPPYPLDVGTYIFDHFAWQWVAA